MLAVWNFFGVIAIHIPKFPVLKEWVYTGFFFAMSGAVISHLANRDDAKELFDPILLPVLTLVSWYFRPAGRKIISINK